MSKLSLSFFATAAVFALIGMIWGVVMGVTDNLTMAPAHAHLNLVGWVSLALMGAFYGLAAERTPKRLGWINYGLSTAAVVVMIPGLAVLLSSNNQVNLAVMLGSLLAILGLATFLAAVVTVWRGRAAS